MGEPRVTIDQFRKVLKAQPFQPFTIHLADGRHYHVPHPEFAWMVPSGRTIIVAQAEESFEIIDLLLVVGLEVRPPAAQAS